MLRHLSFFNVSAHNIIRKAIDTDRMSLVFSLSQTKSLLS